jgi:hypothetical protein
MIKQDPTAPLTDAAHVCSALLMQFEKVAAQQQTLPSTQRLAWLADLLGETKLSP